MASHSTAKTAQLNSQIAYVKSGLLYSSLSCVGLLVLGGIITGIAYSMAEPGGTYVATTGLFLFGALSGVVAIWKLIQLLYFLAKRGTHSEQYSLSQPQPDTQRRWEDLN